MSFDSEARHFEYAVAAPNGQLLGKEIQSGRPGMTLQGLKPPWHSTSLNEAIRWAGEHSAHLIRLGVPQEYANFKVKRRTVVITTGKWEEDANGLG